MEPRFNFGEAVKLLKQGKCVRRVGWNGANMHIYLEENFHAVIRGGHFDGAPIKFDPVICMYTAKQTHQPGWLASQADILAEDWVLVHPS